MYKKGEFGFVWIFALVIGGAILFFAIYGALQVGDTQQLQSNTQSARQITTLTDPLHAGFAEGSYGTISFNQETRVYNTCLEDVDQAGKRIGFGRNDIAVATKDTKEEWKLPGVASSVTNKYIFSEEVNQGENFFVFSKPWAFPYEVSDLILLTSKHYCFRSTPDIIKEDLEGLNIPNVAVEDCDDIEDENPVYVCFGSSANCDIIVSTTDGAYEYGTVRKTDGDYHYQGNLLYAAIFADKNNYECNVERLMYRNTQIAQTFREKSNLMDARGCGSNLGPSLQSWKIQLENYQKASSMGILNAFARQLEQDNTREVCGLWR